MKSLLGKILRKIAPLSLLVGCQNYETWRKDKGPYDVCRYSGASGYPHEGCTYELRTDGTCDPGMVKVKSATPADSSSCMVDL